MSTVPVSRAAEMHSMPVVEDLEVAPVADPVTYEERVHRVRAPKTVQPRRHEYQPQRSSSGKWIAIAALVLVVGSASGWYFLKHQHAVPIATAAPVATESAPTVATVAETVSAPAPAVVPTTLVTASSSAPATKTVAPVSAPKHEEHAAAVVETKPAPPPPEPIVLAANTPKAPRPMDLDAVVPVKLPPASMPDAAPVSAMALPTGTKAAPKLVAPPPEIRVEGTLIKRVNPVYPPMLKTAHIQGQVEIYVHVTPEGTVDQVHRINGQPMLANAAMEAIKQWRYDPARVNGKPVDMTTTVRLNFALAQ